MAARRGLVSNIGLTPFASTHHSVNWSKIEILYFSIIVTGSFKPSGLFPPALQK